MARTVLITGGNRGIGLETARQLAAKEFHVFIGTRDLAAGEKAAASLRKTGAQVSALRLDVSDSSSIKAASDDYAKRANHLDVLINNAGIYPDEGLSILNISREQLVSTFQTNTFGPVAVVQAFLPLLRKAQKA